MSENKEVTRFAYGKTGGRLVRVEVPPGEDVPELESTDILDFSPAGISQVFPVFNSSD